LSVNYQLFSQSASLVSYLVN